MKIIAQTPTSMYGKSKPDLKEKDLEIPRQKATA